MVNDISIIYPKKKKKSKKCKWKSIDAVPWQFPKMVAFQSYHAHFRPLNGGWNFKYNDRVQCIVLVQ